MSAALPLPDGPLVAWYGDDFTGSAAVMEVLSFAGFPSVLFFGIPTKEQIGKFSGFRGIGVAGVSRSKGPDWMDENLPPVFDFLERVGAPVRHYKTCSTLDSSPTVGSIGRAVDLAIAGEEWTPVVMGAPEIGRYQAFGNLFAEAGDGIFRLDRHPTMSVHPVTPMDEGDVGKHLEKQTSRESGLVDLVAIKSGRISETLSEEIAGGKQIISFDIVDEETLGAVGREVWARAADGLFAVGSQGLEYALVAAWRDAGTTLPGSSSMSAPPVDEIAVVSGSCAPTTDQQIEVAAANGFIAITLDPVKALDAATWAQACQEAATQSLAQLDNKLSPIICTARGPEDPSIPALRTAVDRSGLSMEDVNETIGVGLGRILSQIVAEGKLARVAIAGGDSSSHGAQQLGLFAVTAKAPIAPGAALLTGHSEQPDLDGLEIALKGGQMGAPDYFLKLRSGVA